MNVKKLFYFSIACAASVLLFSCSKPTHVKLIPKDAVVVATVNFSSIAKKTLEFKDFLKAETWKKINGNDSVFAMIQNSGIDFSSPGYVFGRSDGSVGILVALDDFESFKTALKDKGKPVTMLTEGSLSYYIGTDFATISDEKVAAYIYRPNTGAEDLKTKAFELMNTTEENSLVKTNDKFSELASQDKDLGFFINAGRISSFTEAYGRPLTLPDLKDVYLTGTSSFENGRIATDYSVHMTKEYLEQYQNVFNSGISEKVQNAHPGNVVASFSVSLNMKAVGESIKKLGYEESLNMYLSFISEELSLDFLTSTFSGDILATVNGYNSVPVQKYDVNTGEMVNAQSTTQNIAVSVGIADQKKADILLQILSRKLLKKDSLNGKYYYSIFNLACATLNDGSITVLSEVPYAMQYITGKTPKLEDATKKMVSGNMLTSVSDFSKVPPAYLEESNPDAKDFVKSLTLESTEFYFPKPTSEKTDGKFLVNFKNKDQNAAIAVLEMAKNALPLLTAPKVDEFPQTPPDTSTTPAL